MSATILNQMLNGYFKFDRRALRPHKPTEKQTSSASSLMMSPKDVLKNNFMAFCKQEKESYLGAETESSFEKMTKLAWGVCAGTQVLNIENLFERETGLFLIRFLKLQKSLSLFPRKESTVILGKNGTPLKLGHRKSNCGIERE